MCVCLRLKGRFVKFQNFMALLEIRPKLWSFSNLPFSLSHRHREISRVRFRAIVRGDDDAPCPFESNRIESNRAPALRVARYVTGENVAIMAVNAFVPMNNTLRMHG